MYLIKPCCLQFTICEQFYQNLLSLTSRRYIMSEIIYNFLELSIFILTVVYLIFAVIAIIKKKDKANIRIIKARIVFESVFLTLFIIKMIMALILGKSIVSELVMAILWAICIPIDCKNLKNAKRVINYDFYIMPDFRDINDDNIIDVQFKD